MNKIDRRLLKARLLVYAIVDSPIQGKQYYQYIVGANPTGDFAGAASNSIASYDGEKWNFIPPQTDGLEVFCIYTQELLRWNGSSWVSEMSFRVPDNVPYTFYHILTQEEIDNKSFDINLFNSSNSYDYKYQYQALFLNGVLQEYFYSDGRATKPDFEFGNNIVNLTVLSNSTNLSKLTVVWKEGFNSLDIRAGDIVALQLLVTYIPK